MMTYQVVTCNYLPQTKVRFECFCSAKNHMKDLIEKNSKLAKTDLAASIRFYRIDENMLPASAKYFPSDRRQNLL